MLKSELAGGKTLTRAQLSAALERHGHALGGPALGLLLMRAELDGLICSGPLSGKQHTYALLEERVPSARSLTRQEALVELTRRYFTSHGPATVKDFAWWSSLTIKDIRQGIAELGSELACVSIGDTDHWHAQSQPPAGPEHETVHLLPNYDEYVVGFSNRDAYWHPSIDGAGISRDNPLFSNTIVHDGKIVGTWTRTLGRETVSVSLSPFNTLDDVTWLLQDAIDQFGTFQNRPVRWV